MRDMVSYRVIGPDPEDLPADPADMPPLTREEALVGFAEWLKAMDDPEDVLAQEARRSVTLDRIIMRAKWALAAEPSDVLLARELFALCDAATPGLTATCTCSAHLEEGCDHPGKVLAWHLDPDKVREVLGRYVDE